MRHYNLIMRLLFLLFFLTNSFVLFAQQKERDSLFLILRSKDISESQRADIYAQMSFEFRDTAPIKGIEYGEKAIEIGGKVGNEFAVNKGLSHTGINYKNIGNYPKAMQYFLQSADMAKRRKDLETEAYAHIDMGRIYQAQKNYIKTEENYNEAKIIAELKKDDKILAYVYINLARFYKETNRYDLALESGTKSLKLRQIVKDNRGIATSYQVIADIYNLQKNYVKAVENYDLSDTFLNAAKSKRGLIGNIIGKAQVLKKQGDNVVALQKANEGLIMAQALGDLIYVRDACELLTAIYLQEKDYKNAIKYQTTLILAKDSLMNEDDTRKVSNLENMREKELETIAQKAKEENENFIKVVIALIVIIVLASAGTITFISYQNNKKTQLSNKQLQNQKEEIEAINNELGYKNIEIERKNRENLESLTYAQRIQRSILPTNTDFFDRFPDSFVFYQPRELVGGDFYWKYHNHSDNMTYLAVADCTGHGAPGALLTMVCKAALSKVIVENDIKEVNEILSLTHKEIVLALSQKNNLNGDGMDIVLCKIDNNKKTADFASARTAFYVLQDNVMQTFGGDLYPVGGVATVFPDEREYRIQTINITSPTVLYLASDGYQDQFGGEKNKKFMKKKFQELLVTLQETPIQKQDVIIKQVMDDWMKQLGQTLVEQTDDMVVIGVKLA